MKNNARTISDNKKHDKTAKKKSLPPEKSLSPKKKKDEKKNIVETGKKKSGLKDSATFRRLAAHPRYKKHAERYQNILENIRDGYFEVDFAGNFTFFNDSVGRILGYSSEELTGMNYQQYTDKESAKKVFQAFNEVYKTGEYTEGLDWRIIRKDGAKRYIEASVSLLKDSTGKQKGFRSIIRDITERKQMEERYRRIFENAQNGIYQSTLDGRFIMANQSMAQILGYDSPEDLILSITDISRQLYANPEECMQFIEIMEKQGLVKNSEIQFKKKDGRMIWISRTAQVVRDEKGQVLYYEGIIEDITDRKDSLDRLRNALGGTVRALASVVETRDPYTAGHQRHVADLALAIAKEMDLPTDRIEGLRMAAIIHDIGKISVPAEILTKPGKLTDLEFSMIKIHSQSGYNILKDIDFPWPVALMVYEHHERMNGTGYPRNLKGNDILLEARILAISDVVESMASHRPYRAALGIEAALEEIEKNKGFIYDDVVVDACLRLFREKGYKLT
ncbi:MAG: PAS domain S-box protein [Deltaproteobacteria bacterium HGW-Deltaproteobacteria-13]|jgi:PAS domain S-box-containing protein/putative nucleotidyltransferase with HDIG domain|nr:MAG: PAS domain S-box protein [Deltaproteobacteria bacterium HGW-Deltaproteobacteria-13]